MTLHMTEQPQRSPQQGRTPAGTRNHHATQAGGSPKKTFVRNPRRETTASGTRTYTKSETPRTTPTAPGTKSTQNSQTIPPVRRRTNPQSIRTKDPQKKKTTHPAKGRPRTESKKGGKSSGRNSFRKSNVITMVKSSPLEQLKTIPPLKDGDIRFVPVCGTEGIGTNMLFVEYKDEIVVIDAGFGFSNVATPGINYTIPNTAYLKANKHKIKALVITHGHLDHVGGIPYVIEDLGNPPIYTREFGAMFIRKKLEEFPQLPKTNIVVVEPHDDYLPLSKNLKVKFFGLTHSIPDSTGVIIQTPLGGIVSTGDVRVENRDGVVNQKEIDQYAFFEKENILLLAIDSTNIENPGWSLSEELVYENIDIMIKDTIGRLFIAAFSSQVERLMQFMKSAKKHGKYIAFEGRSIKSNMGIAKHLNLTDFGHVISIKEIDQYPPNKIVIILTGSQGEEFAALNRISNGTHPTLKLNTNDTIVLSSSIVPGNHYPVTQLKNNLYKGSYNVITYRDNKNVHASGHGNREELKWVHSKIPYKFLMPVHGEPYMTRMHAHMAINELGLRKDQVIVPDNGTIAEIRENGTKYVKLKEHIPNETIAVDGTMIGPLRAVVMEDRLKLADSGMFVIVVSIDTKSKKLKKSPDIISRGFVYLRESQKLLGSIRTLVQKTAEEYTSKVNGKIDFDDAKKLISDKVGKYILQRTGKEPIVIPVVLSV